MLQRSDKGKEARQYFIHCEETLRQQMSSTCLPSAKQLAQMVIKAEGEKEQMLAQLDTANQLVQLNVPKVIFADTVSASKNSILIGELAKILKQNGVDMGQNRLFEWLRGKGYLISRKGTDFNMPTQMSMEKSLFEIKETVISHASGHTTVSKTPKVTGVGQQYFVNKFLNNLKKSA